MPSQARGTLPFTAQTVALKYKHFTSLIRINRCKPIEALFTCNSMGQVYPTTDCMIYTHNPTAEKKDTTSRETSHKPLHRSKLAHRRLVCCSERNIHIAQNISEVKI